ncbi:preprotein translocase subunit SecE [Candidatus Gottesmanbacteria bacterium RBG_16_43_7]|uniref:Protein translocase subunit SecE n=1 Tax=Candidatus Gottesmanbacteria bacterium RBG_16_43_7 TaxID=1798373 RepID=A0A1F5Z910_9BACT|nr:MAG: preprotein translocase subunit SecE [Candidatus Gottesmanbacteria bacterium RBG_16_43_7]
MEKPNLPQIPKTAPIIFIKEVRNELSKVAWPSRAETVKLTVVVIAISFLVGAFIGGLDALFVNITSIVFRR